MEEPKKKEEEKVTIPKSTLDSLVDKVEKQSKQINMLVEVADKSRLHRYEAAHKDMSQKTIKVSTYGGKIVTGWKMMTNDVYQDNQGRWHEKQEVEIYLIDNTKKLIPYIEFVRNIKKVGGTIIGKTSNADGNNVIKIDVMGKHIEIGETFVN